MRSVLLLCCLALVFFVPMPHAEAHARLVRSIPAKDADPAPAPARAELWFNELLENGFNSVTVYPSKELGTPKHSEFTSGKPEVDARDRTHLFVSLKSLPAGEYILEWRVLSRDGHSAPGRLTFRVK